MKRTFVRFAVAVACASLSVSVLLPGHARVEASGPYGATYCSDSSRTFWFLHISDLHIGASSTAANNLAWMLGEGRAVINPLFTVATGDLTDSTNGNVLGYPNGPYQSEWDAYKAIVTNAGVTAADYYDLPGNHDAYSDRNFQYYRANAWQGPNYSPGGQLAWTKTVAGGVYHFVGVNTADNTGAAFSLFAPYGDHAGLDATELSTLEADLTSTPATTANLSFVFGHHPVTGTGNSQDTYLYYGASRFVGDLSARGVSAYDYGHAHDNVETLFTGDSYTGTIAPGVRYTRIASLGKSTGNTYSVIAVDCNSVSEVTQPLRTWPLVLVTAPASKYIGSAFNPFGYDVVAGQPSPIRALVFAPAGTPTLVQFSVDGGAWVPMSQVNGPQWTGNWDSSAVPPGEHTVAVQATAGTTTRSHVIKVTVVSSNPPAADTVTATATYTTKSRTLLVQATSSAAPTAKLTVVNYGAMTYNATRGLYVYQKKVSARPTTVTVTSSAGGSATASVTVK